MAGYIRAKATEARKRQFARMSGAKPPAPRGDSAREVACLPGRRGCPGDIAGPYDRSPQLLQGLVRPARFRRHARYRMSSGPVWRLLVKATQCRPSAHSAPDPCWRTPISWDLLLARMQIVVRKPGSSPREPANCIAVRCQGAGAIRVSGMSRESVIRLSQAPHASSTRVSTAPVMSTAAA